MARRRRALTATLAGIGMLAAPLAAIPAVAAPAEGGSASSIDQALQAGADYRDGRYFVILKEDPVATYTGGTAGFAATATDGGGLDVDAPAVQKYGSHLTARQLEVAHSASSRLNVERHFTTALNAFVSELTAEQARELAKDDRVLGVSEVQQYAPDYSSTEFLGLPGPGGAWDNHFGGVEGAGQGVVVGVIDTGYYPEQEMLAGEPVAALSGEPQVGEPYLTGSGQIAMLKADGTTFSGDCEAGEDFAGDECNSKVLSARYYSEDFEAFVPEEDRAPNERLSPIDISSHGTHTATTAAGNHGVDQVMNGGASYGEGSGVAPEAKVSVYKICWEDTDPDTGGCYGTSSVAAIEQAIVDGVDVLNYSISGSNNSVIDPVSLAFKSAAEAGIFVSTSAGNSGPTTQTVNHSAPWLTSVAATTFSDELSGTVEFPDGTAVRGVSSMTEGVGPADIVLASEVGLPITEDLDAEDISLCAPGSLDPAAAEGTIVVCDRGVYDRVAKSAEVERAGGVGMVLVNIGGGSEDADLHAVPTVHTSDESIKDLVASTDQQATLVVGDTTDLDPVPVPQIAGFSSRGPSTAADSELLKPDVAAPGVNVLAGVSPLDPMYNGDSYGLMSGTSMAAPNLAGMAALMSAKYPDWSPMAVKSAMMTSAGDVLNADGSASADSFATGAGSADPAAMVNPGLVYEADARQWDALILGDIAGRDVNVPSIAVNDLLGAATVTRTVTATETGTWSAQGSVPGYEVTAAPSTLSLEKGESAEVEITLTRTDAEADVWSHGTFTLARPGATAVTSPVTVRAVDVLAEDTLEGEGASGAVETELESGVTGNLEPEIEGLGLAELEDFSKVPGGLYGGDDASNHVTETVVPEGATSVSWNLNAGDEVSDWDLFVVTPEGAVIQAATASGSEELVLTDPAPGTYAAISNLYSSPGSASVPASMEAVVLEGDSGNLSVTPDPVAVQNGESADVEVEWSGLTPGTWKGFVEWAPGTRTAVSVTVDEGGTGPGECDLEDFADNAEGSQYYENVRWMQCDGITTGYEDNTYRKHRDISRGESVAFLYRYMDSPTVTDPADFPDIPESSTFFDAISWADAEEITTGYEDGTFRQFVEVTRGEFASFVFRTVGPEAGTVADEGFSDVPETSAHYEAISWMASEGISIGYGDGTYRPYDPITRGEVAALMSRTDGVVTE
ncbi:S8 family serine peptidase [Microbacterium sp. A93]|uniref:S8 family serine peptidase n=1 Tax=Microbacterium sp. A93 TaxID=3450716 RepID=UPI003F444970